MYTLNEVSEWRECVESRIAASGDGEHELLDAVGTLKRRRESLRLRTACQRPACTRFHVRAGDWRFCVLHNSDRLVAKWRH